MTSAVNGTNALHGRRILIVEDEAIVAMLLEDMLADLGCVVVGPAGRVAEALKLLGDDGIDVAILDINLAGEKIDPVADALAARAVPFVFTSGYGASGVPDAYADRATVAKPFRLEQLESALRAVL